VKRWGFDGLPNLFFLAVILGAVFVNRPVFLREAIDARRRAPAPGSPPPNPFTRQTILISVRSGSRRLFAGILPR